VEIGSRIRARREALELTQEELARELGVTHQHVSRIEGSLNAPSLELVVKLSRVLGVTADFLLAGADPPPRDVKGAIRGLPGVTAAAKRHLIGLIDELSRD
jgi:transcriptional regulator with XRE-family HTH domain